MARTESAPINKQASVSEKPSKTVKQVEVPKPQLEKVEAKAEVPEPQPERPVEVATQTQAPIQTSCESEIGKYDWHQGIAIAVASAESGLRPDAVNNNPSTGDYSVGCFQINIYGANAYTRPSEQALKDPATNVAWAHKLYVGNGNSFVGQWGVCRAKVSCY